MPKRKREDPEPASGKSSESSKGQTARQVRSERVIERGNENLAKAFKVAKGFERQKLSRRRKTAQTQKNQKDVERIDAETEALKVSSSHHALQMHSTDYIPGSRPFHYSLQLSGKNSLENQSHCHLTTHTR